MGDGKDVIDKPDSVDINSYSSDCYVITNTEDMITAMIMIMIMIWYL